MDRLLAEFLGCRSFAVIGSFRNTEKYAYKIVRYLLKKDKAVFPVNPGTREVEGLPCVPDISLLPVKPDVVNLVTPPESTEKIIRDCISMGIKRVWMQPGAESEDAIRFCESNGISAVHGACILLQ